MLGWRRLTSFLKRIRRIVRRAVHLLTPEEDTEYVGWKRLEIALGHFVDIVSKNEDDGYFTVGLLATCPSMPGLIAGLQHSGLNGAPIRVGRAVRLPLGIACSRSAAWRQR